jgi:hypothetical protein
MMTAPGPAHQFDSVDLPSSRGLAAELSEKKKKKKLSWSGESLDKRVRFPRVCVLERELRWL